MTQAKRLIINTCATYGRMMITVGMGLITTRLLLQALGEVDYGIFIVLGAGLSFLMALEDGLTSSTQRHLAYEIGRNDPHATSIVFSTMFVLYLGLALLIVILGETLAPLLLHNLTIPPARFFAAQWVYQMMLINLGMIIVATPFRAVFTARQALVQEAGFSILDSVLSLTIAVSVLFLTGDALIWYMGLLACRQGLLAAVRIVSATLQFPESRFRRSMFHRSHLKGLMSFASWTLLGDLFWRLNTQGSSILLNVYFGPVINTAFGVAAQISGYHTSLTQTIMGATSPALSQLEGAGRRDQVRTLACASGKLSALLGLLITIPFTLEISTILNLWLKKVPDFTTFLVPFIVITATIELLTRGLFWTMRAIGDIGKQVKLEILIYTAPLPIVWLLFHLGYTPKSLPIVLLVVSIIASVIRAHVFGKCAGVSLMMWLKKTVAPVIKVSLAMIILVYPFHWYMAPGVTRLLTIVILLGLAALPVIWFLGLDDLERSYFKRFLQPIFAKRTLALQGLPKTEQ